MMMTTIYLLIVVIVLLIGALAAQTFLHASERRDLYNRIMARDLADYEYSQNKKKNHKDGVKPKTNYYKENMDRAYNGQQGFKAEE
jgi:flagellar basal body-associated protein FliL